MDFIYQYAGWGTKALEVAIGLVFLVHGWKKITNPLPAGKLFGKGKQVGLIFGIAEVLAGVMVATGMGTFTATIVISVIMLGAIYHKVVKWKVPFTTDTAGWEFDLILLAGALTLLLG
jgi:uncharacterized membrane protein YphA (DoxX/SURF4 family)